MSEQAIRDLEEFLSKYLSKNGIKYTVKIKKAEENKDGKESVCNEYGHS